MLSDPFLLFIVLGPGFAALAGLVHKQLGDKAVMLITTSIVCAAGLLSLIQLFGFAFGEHGPSRAPIVLMEWMSVGSFQANWAIRVDALSIVMMAVVTSVSGLVHVYSWGYMSDDPHRSRFFAYLSLFTFAMLMLVVADNFVQLFFGWEGVGLASYLLIGFWYTKKAPNDAAIKAFVTNRVGDFGLALGVMAVFFVFGSVEFGPVLEAIRENTFEVDGVARISALVSGETPQSATFAFLGYKLNALEVIGVLLFIGAMGKSAQFFLHVWLPDAMEGPTPVSALIHAATMVTAGVYLVCLMSPVYEHTAFASAIITLVGLVTAFYAATVGLAQNDIKRVIAYSTCSQLGYMFFAAGVGAYDAAMFHLFTHAFFKALLFLGAGSVIHGMHHEQDMRLMGGVAKYMKVTYAVMLIGTIAIIGLGVPFTQFGFSGFFSKDAILEAAYVAGANGVSFGMLAFWAGIAAALLTSFYSFRLLFMTFHGPYTGAHHVHGHHASHGDDAHDDDAMSVHDDHAHGDPHESPWVMLVPLILLAIGAVAAGVVFYEPMFHHAKEFWGDAIYKTDASPSYKDISALKKDPSSTWVFYAPIVVTVIGFFGALLTYFFNRGIGKKIAQSGGPLHGMFANKWYFDELYNATVVKATRGLGDLFWKVGDKKIIDGLGPDGVSGLTKWLAAKQSKMHTGYLYHYAFVIIGAALLFGGVLYFRNGGIG